MNELDKELADNISEATGFEFTEYDPDKEKEYHYMAAKWTREAQEDMKRFHSVSMWDEIKKFFVNELDKEMKQVPEKKFTKFCIVPVDEGRRAKIGLL